MNTKLYYFTGTGNSLAIARDLAARLPADLQAIKAVVDQDAIKIESGACIGLVFPAYNHRIPYIIKRFLDRLQGIEDRYIFAVCTYGGSPCIALEYVAKLLLARGGSLAAGFGVKMPYNYINPQKGIAGLLKPFVLREVPEAEQRQLFQEADKKVERISEAVRFRRTGIIDVEHQRLEHAVDHLNLRETMQKYVWLKVAGYRGKTSLACLESVQLMDCGFTVDDRCVRCGICLSVCPVGNIEMSAEGPRWKHRCEQCFACLHWCPKSALQFGEGTAGCTRYHHPRISLSDML